MVSNFGLALLPSLLFEFWPKNSIFIPNYFFASVSNLICPIGFLNVLCYYLRAVESPFVILYCMMNVGKVFGTPKDRVCLIHDCFLCLRIWRMSEFLCVILPQTDNTGVHVLSIFPVSFEGRDLAKFPWTQNESHSLNCSLYSLLFDSPFMSWNISISATSRNFRGRISWFWKLWTKSSFETH